MRKEKDFELCCFIAKEKFTRNFTNHFHILGKKTKRAWVSSVPSFEKHTLDFRRQTSNFQSFEKKEGVDFWGFFFSNNLLSKGWGPRGISYYLNSFDIK